MGSRWYLGLVCVLALGCGRDGPRTYPLAGKVELAGGSTKVLAGSHVEAVLESDPKVRASGEIQEDGRFRLDTIRAGSILNGAGEGKYKVRILLTEDDRQSRKQAAKAVAPRYLDFRTSGLSFDVPAKGEITLALSPR